MAAVGLLAAQGLRAFPARDLNGLLSGDFAVDERGFQIGHKAITIQWQDGKQVVVWPDEAAAGRLKFPTPLAPAVIPSRQSGRRRCSHGRRSDRVISVAALAHGRSWQILLQKSVEGVCEGDSVFLERFATGAADDGAAQPRSGAVFLLVSA
jgi:hypothetical protein